MPEGTQEQQLIPVTTIDKFLVSKGISTRMSVATEYFKAMPEVNSIHVLTLVKAPRKPHAYPHARALWKLRYLFSNELDALGFVDNYMEDLLLHSAPQTSFACYLENGLQADIDMFTDVFAEAIKNICPFTELPEKSFLRILIEDNGSVFLTLDRFIAPEQLLC